MIRSLDPDVPRWARFVLNHSASLKGLFLEKPGAARPADFVALAEEIMAKRPDLVVEVGYELHYSEAMSVARRVIKESVLGDIASARFHGGCPSGAGMDLWQSIPEDLGGIMQTEGCHTLENILDLFGPPECLVSNIRKLPQRPPHPVVEWMPDLFSGTKRDDQSSIGSLMYEDIASAILEYPNKTILLDLTAWEPTEWCHEWAIDIYGTNGSLHAIPNPPAATLYLREARDDYPMGKSQVPLASAKGISDMVNCYMRQFESLVKRIRGQTPDDGDCRLENATGILLVIDAAYQSARSRQWVDIVASR